MLVRKGFEFDLKVTLLRNFLYKKKKRKRFIPGRSTKSNALFPQKKKKKKKSNQMLFMKHK